MTPGDSDPTPSRDHILDLVRRMFMRHGRCRPRKDKACTACNAKDELRKIAKEWKGPMVRLIGGLGDFPVTPNFPAQENGTE